MSPVSTSPPRQQFERWCSTERPAPYIRTTGSYNAAVELYEWNIAVSGALYETLGAVEVFLRNAIQDSLASWHRAAGRPGSWFDYPAANLSAPALADVAKARARLRAPETEGRIVAELPFGFWRFLLERRHQANLWPRVRRAFPNLPGGRREQLRDDVLVLHGLRNRLAHHEPVHASTWPRSTGGCLPLPTTSTPPRVTGCKVSRECPASWPVGHRLGSASPVARSAGADRVGAPQAKTMSHTQASRSDGYSARAGSAGIPGDGDCRRGCISRPRSTAEPETAPLSRRLRREFDPRTGRIR